MNARRSQSKKRTYARKVSRTACVVFILLAIMAAVALILSKGVLKAFLRTFFVELACVVAFMILRSNLKSRKKGRYKNRNKNGSTDSKSLKTCNSPNDDLSNKSDDYSNNDLKRPDLKRPQRFRVVKKNFNWNVKDDVSVKTSTGHKDLFDRNMIQEKRSKSTQEAVRKDFANRIAVLYRHTSVPYTSLSIFSQKSVKKNEAAESIIEQLNSKPDSSESEADTSKK